MASRSQSSGPGFGAIVAGIALVALAIYSFRDPSVTTSAEMASRGEPPVPGQPARTQGKATSAESPGTSATSRDITTLLEDAFRDFPAAKGEEESRTILSNLREAIRGAPPEKAAAEILAFLRQNRDVPTGLPFSVGADGMLDNAPTLRLALLDLLPSLDPHAALAMARELMDRRTTPDEYALSLRNLAWNDLDGDMRQELSKRFLAMLDTPWVREPTAGFLEAMDIAVELGGRPVFERVISLARDASSRSDDVLSQAAWMALDRMVLREPSILTTSFERDPAWLGFAPLQRASLLSRLDIADPAQRDIFTAYLSAPRTADELDYFTSLFPNRNYLQGHRLVTSEEETPSIDDIAADDAKVAGILKTIEKSENPQVSSIAARILVRLQDGSGQ